MVEGHFKETNCFGSIMAPKRKSKSELRSQKAKLRAQSRRSELGDSSNDVVDGGVVECQVSSSVQEQ